MDYMDFNDNDSQIDKVVKSGMDYDLSNQSHATLPNRALRYNTNNDRYEILIIPIAM